MTASNNAPDEIAIRNVIQLYIEGWRGAPDKFHEAFDPDAWIFFTDAEGQEHKSQLTEQFDKWAATGWQIEGEIISLQRSGDIATVLLRFDNKTRPDASYMDIHTLLRVDKRWRITNKTATHISRAS
ncbi:nuclear transport factor 2 family protein [Lutimaribacter marinistellae]|uniref:Nuclear transport factor 2 family protein n=1 Tax=Lutimaribacter marinistellae TaxID=1820329 RepID=A0ABV7TCE1_9RHOB